MRFGWMTDREVFCIFLLIPFLLLSTFLEVKRGVIEERVLFAAAGIRLLLLAVELAADPFLWEIQFVSFIHGCGIALLVVLACFLLTGCSIGRGYLELFFVMGMYDTAGYMLWIFILGILLSTLSALVFLALGKADLESDFSITPAIFLVYMVFCFLVFWDKKIM